MVATLHVPSKHLRRHSATTSAGKNLESPGKSSESGLGKRAKNKTKKKDRPSFHILLALMQMTVLEGKSGGTKGMVVSSTGGVEV